MDLGIVLNRSDERASPTPQTDNSSAQHWILSGWLHDVNVLYHRGQFVTIFPAEIRRAKATCSTTRLSSASASRNTSVGPNRGRPASLPTTPPGPRRARRRKPRGP